MFFVVDQQKRNRLNPRSTASSPLSDETEWKSIPDDQNRLLFPLREDPPSNSVTYSSAEYLDAMSSSSSSSSGDEEERRLRGAKRPRKSQGSDDDGKRDESAEPSSRSASDRATLASLSHLLETDAIPSTPVTSTGGGERPRTAPPPPPPTSEGDGDSPPIVIESVGVQRDAAVATASAALAAARTRLQQEEEEEEEVEQQWLRLNPADVMKLFEGIGDPQQMPSPSHITVDIPPFGFLDAIVEVGQVFA